MTATGIVTVARYVVDGEPVSKQRPRLGRGRRTYTPTKTLDAEARVAWGYRQAAPGPPDPSARFAVSATFHCKTGHRRDVDNLLKLVLDGLNGVAFADDWQVARISAEVHRGAVEARTEIVIARIEEATS